MLGLKIKYGLILLPILVIAQSRIIYAANLTNRSITVSRSSPSTISVHTFNYNIPSNTALGSIEFEYCTNSPFVGTACTAPSGFSASSAVLSSQSGETGFSIHASSTINRIVLTRTAAPSSPGAVQYVFSNITNPSTARQTVYVRVATFAANDGTGPRTDEGAVAFSTDGLLTTAGFVPPYLRFCVGITVSADCSTASGNYINLGTLSSTQTKTGTSQMAAYTNDESGYTISLIGTSMTSGNNIIPAMSTPQASTTGSSQFGINLRANTNPLVGSDVTGSGTGSPSIDYNQSNIYKFNSGDVVASSTVSTEANVFTSSYVVNVSTGQQPGIYSTTLTYVAVATF